MRELKIHGSRTAVWRFFQRHKITGPWVVAHVRVVTPSGDPV
jgi:hypothetical protein